VSFEAVVASSYERRTPQFAASFGTLSSKTSRSPVANVAADVEIEIDRSVGVAIDPSDVVAEPRVVVLPAIGLIAKTLFVSWADAVVVVVFAEIAPALL